MEFLFNNPAQERLRHTQMEHQRQQRERARRSASFDLVSNLAALSRHYPHMEPGVLVGLAQSGARPGDAPVEELSQLAAEQEVSSDGGLFKDIGDVVTAPVRAVADVASDVGGALADVARPTVRGLFTALQTPFEEIQGAIGELAAGNNPFGRAHSVGLIALGDLLEGEGVDLGSGFFAGGEVREQQAEVMKDIGRELGLRDQGFTVGRYFANQIFEPGSIAYNTLSGTLDAVNAIALDPANIAGAKLAKMRRLKKLLTNEPARAIDEIGGISQGLRPSLLPEVVHPWAVSDEAAPLRQYLAGEKNFERMWASTGRGKLGSRTVNELVDAEDEETVVRILTREMGLSGDTKPERLLLEKLSAPAAARNNARGMVARGTQQGFETLIGRPTHEVRLLGRMPQGFFDIRDDDFMVEKIDRVLRNAKVNSETRGLRMREWLQAEGPEAKYQVARKIYSDDIAGQLAEEGIDQDTISDVTTLFFDRFDRDRTFWRQQVSEGTPAGKALVQEMGLEEFEPHMVEEFLSNVIELPNPREIRRALSPFRNLLANKELGSRMPVALADRLSSRIWKRTVLMRPAYPVRVIGEEQLRMAMAGYESMWRHPISFIAYVMGKKGLGREFFDDETGQAVSAWQQVGQRSLGAQVGDVRRDVVVSKGTARYGTDAPDHLTDALVDEYTKFRHSPVMRRIAQGDDLRAIQDDFWEGSLEEQRRWLGDARPELLESRQAADNYIETYVERLAQHDLRDPQIREVIATGRLPLEEASVGARAKARIDGRSRRVDVVGREGDQLRVSVRGEEHLVSPDDLTEVHAPLFAKDQHGRLKATKHFKQWLRQNVDEGIETGRITPDFEVTGDKYLRGVDGQTRTWWDDATDWAFSEVFMGRWTDLFSRHPTLQQAWWKRMDEILPLMDGKAQREVIETARKANLDKFNVFPWRNPVTRMEQKVGKRTGNLTFKEADMYSRGHAVDETKNLLYDLSERGQFFDIARLIFPFGDAWAEILTRWGGILRKEPRAIRRFQQVIGDPPIEDEEGERTFGGTGLRGTAIGDTLSKVPGIGGAFEPGQGFFYQNPNGEEVFAYPGTAFMSEKLLGVPVPLEGRLSGLNLTAEVLPGVGPVAQLPAAYFLPHQPEWDTIRETLFPFGEPEVGDVPWSFLPAWAEKFRTASDQLRSPEQQRSFNNTVMHIASQMVTMGDADKPQSRSEMRKLISDATQKAKRFWVIRGLTQTTAPSAPSPKFLAQDKDGTLVAATVLREEFWNMVEEKGMERATTEFLNKHGDQSFMLMQPFTNSLVYGAPVTREGLDWARQNPQLRDALPNTYGLFAPTGGDFDYPAYVEQFARGEREGLNPDQYVQLANNRIARNVYERWKKKVGPNPTPQARALLRNLQDILTHQYPGYSPGLGGVAGLGKKIPPEMAIQELRKAAQIPKVAETERGQAVEAFLRMWDGANERAKAMGLVSMQRAKSARPLRDVVRMYASALTERFEGFGPIYDQVFDRLLADDLDAPAQEAA